MKGKILLSLLTVLMINISSLLADDGISKQTFIYSIKGNDTLRLDKYEKFTTAENKICIIFVFGGGFYTGSRDAQRNVDYMNLLAQNGYTAVAIDYRLGMKVLKERKADGKQEMKGLFENAIKMAVEDLYDATTFVYNHANEWNINKDMIIANGSSAGAITVLQGEYEICNTTPITNNLPANFNYAGVISFAGAIFSDSGKLKWKNPPCPIQMFHGKVDSIIPFNQISIFKYHFCGSEHIAKQLDKMKRPYFFYEVEKESHEIATLPMKENIDEINEFIRDYIVKKKHLAIVIDKNNLDDPNQRKELKLKDYIKASKARKKSEKANGSNPVPNTLPQPKEQ